jgi:LysR family cys regulon transcriptional activator
MSLAHLRALWETVRQNFNPAKATVLFTPAPGAARQIRELEEELGVPLFERGGKRLTRLSEKTQQAPTGGACWWATGLDRRFSN